MTTDRRIISFAQAEGIQPLPGPLSPKEMSPSLTASLWRCVHWHMSNDVGDSRGMGGPARMRANWNNIMRSWHVDHLHGLIDEYSDVAAKLIAIAKSTITSNDYVKVFDFIQFILRHRNCPNGFTAGIDAILEKQQAAYRIIDMTVMPIASEHEAVMVAKTFADLAQSEFGGARAHLRAAAVLIDSGAFSDSVRESIHAVEAVAKKLAPEMSTLPNALNILAKKGHIHPALRGGFDKLYAYTSDQDGIRHALTEDSANVDSTDALYMFGACASFISYLIGKARSANIPLT